VRNELGEAHQLGEQIDGRAAPGRLAARGHPARRVDLHDPRLQGDRVHEAHGVAGDQARQLALDGREPARLDLDQNALADEIDHEAVDGHLEAIAGLGAPALQRRVQRLLAERSDAVSGHPSGD
jgi:hypothetical protein